MKSVIDIYGYYIDSDEIKTLKQTVKEFVKKYQNKLECEESTKLYKISVLSSNLLHQVKQIIEDETFDITCIKLCHAGHYAKTEENATACKAFRVRRGTKDDYEYEYTYKL